MEITLEDAVNKLLEAGVPAFLDFGGNVEIVVEDGTVTFYQAADHSVWFQPSMSLRPQPGESAEAVVNRVVTATRERS